LLQLRKDVSSFPCDLLRRYIKRETWNGWWNKHPNCRYYQRDNGCVLNQCVFIDGKEYEILADYLIHVSAAEQDTIDRKVLYHKINEAIGGPAGKGNRRALPLCIMLFIMVRTPFFLLSVLLSVVLFVIVFLCVYLPVCLSVCVCLFSCPSICLSVYLCMLCLSVCLSMYLPVHLSIYLSFCLSVCLLFVCLFVCLCVSLTLNLVPIFDAFLRIALVFHKLDMTLVTRGSNTITKSGSANSSYQRTLI